MTQETCNIICICKHAKKGKIKDTIKRYLRFTTSANKELDSSLYTFTEEDVRVALSGALRDFKTNASMEVCNQICNIFDAYILTACSDTIDNPSSLTDVIIKVFRNCKVRDTNLIKGFYTTINGFDETQLLTASKFLETFLQEE